MNKITYGKFDKFNCFMENELPISKDEILSRLEEHQEFKASASITHKQNKKIALLNLNIETLQKQVKLAHKHIAGDLPPYGAITASASIAGHHLATRKQIMSTPADRFNGDGEILDS
ncbi:MAG: hypothetical protein K6L81_02455 [Agarilytica sp.]